MSRPSRRTGSSSRPITVCDHRCPARAAESFVAFAGLKGASPRTAGPPRGTSLRRAAEEPSRHFELTRVSTDDPAEAPWGAAGSHSTERRSLIGATVQPYVRKWSSISRPSIAPLVAVRPSPPAPTVRLRTVHRSAADDLKPCVREADAADEDRAWSETRRRET